ncbi:conserved hypothetical protein [Pseudarthrobacter chlorophenolicus A6]|uniref:Uncharacterized protein n=1 Tax=Pseudarthrobacter chlorophenolicus (strain ATCC 700700 / DSM 12829 / CIP 107037 / JCM 12360 / KCTC 9906 / NCIMB 13794 / A6) TaxID=452863 RepID=B8HEL1_PSECP|nr:hypothetical protein [Pseudarthrobacter chlorophenolicus]ACL40956.1 conserved hypothetical protein [Pseudarthrobacter chlorophenolicus A6]SDQ72261.1 hypothetical protein SAMN04489738_2485 [Pseudarthrobacter chlorophenolicus]
MPEGTTYDDGTHQGADLEVAAWTAILDAMEAAADHAEALLGKPDHGHRGDWTPAGVPGPLPLQLQERALLLGDRQEDLVRRLEEARMSTQRQLNAVSSVPGVGEASAAVYLDITG